MVAYFRLQTYLIIALGAAVGLLTALLGLSEILAAQVFFVRLFTVVLCVIVGVVLGRLLATVIANRRIKNMNALLYRQGQPDAFLNVFEPVAKKVQPGTVEQIDSQCKIAFAREALGDFEKGLEALEGLDPSQLKLHMLQCTALLENQKLRLLLMKEDIESAQKQLAVLAEIQETAASRAPTLGKNLAECIRLGQNWLHVLQGEDCDLDYLNEEIRLSGNRIHKAEMLLLLGRAQENSGDTASAKTSFEEAAGTAPDLYAGAAARARLKDAC